MVAAVTLPLDCASVAFAEKKVPSEETSKSAGAAISMSATRLVPFTVKDLAAEGAEARAKNGASEVVEGEIVGTITVPLRAMVAEVKFGAEMVRLPVTGPGWVVEAMRA